MTEFNPLFVLNAAVFALIGIVIFIGTFVRGPGWNKTGER